MKKLLLFGGSSYIVPVIKTAHELGIYVITCDYLPENIAHKHSDKYQNISIIDKEAVLRMAMEEKIDGIMSFACDPGVLTAAYVAEKMGLPFQCSYEATAILQDKGLFRRFLTDNGFNTPHAKRYQNTVIPSGDVDFFSWPVIVKPVDSAGSKGVTKVDHPEDLADAIDIAIRNSLSGAFIIEDFLTFTGFHSSADPFSVEGRLQYVSYSDQLFDQEAENAYTPSLIIWPTTMKSSYQTYLSKETQRLFDLLQMKTGIYNIESCVDINGNPYLMEVSPRGGGCKIAEIQEMAMGGNLIENEIRKAVNMPLISLQQNPCNGHWCEMVVHARPGQQGHLSRIVIDPEIEKKYIRKKSLVAKPGDIVKPFTGANMSLGDVFLRFESREELDNIMSRSAEWLKIIVE